MYDFHNNFDSRNSVVSLIFKVLEVLEWKFLGYDVFAAWPNEALLYTYSNKTKIFHLLHRVCTMKYTTNPNITPRSPVNIKKAKVLFHVLRRNLLSMELVDMAPNLYITGIQRRRKINICSKFLLDIDPLLPAVYSDLTVEGSINERINTSFGIMVCYMHFL